MLIEAFDTVVFAEGLLGRLKDAQKLIARKQLPDEKQWLATAVERLAAAVGPLEGLAVKSAQLPELEPVRGDLAKSLQHGAIDAVERLQAGITFVGGPRAPVLEELFGPYKLPPLRRAAREEFEKFIGSFNKRLKAQYTKRILAGDEFAPVQPALAQLAAAFDAWKNAFSPEPLPEAEADKLRAQLTVAADALVEPMHQARLLAEAALISVDGAFAETGLAAKPKKRSAPKAAAPEVEPQPETDEEVAAEAAAAEAEAQPPPEVTEKVAPKPAKKGRAAARS
ncbi:MAG: hypothetical protein IPJ65_26120 [Archangiaceae bacterium]|nr:hypothetical protein [Archangiaceae bacterium]